MAGSRRTEGKNNGIAPGVTEFSVPCETLHSDWSKSTSPKVPTQSSTGSPAGFVPRGSAVQVVAVQLSHAIGSEDTPRVNC